MKMIQDGRCERQERMNNKNGKCMVKSKRIVAIWNDDNSNKRWWQMLGLKKGNRYHIANKTEGGEISSVPRSLY